MRLVSNNELSTYKVLPFDLYTDNRKKILEAGEILTPGKLIMLKNYVKIYTEDFNNDDSPKAELNVNNKNIPSQLLNFSYDSLDINDFETVVNQSAYIASDVQVKIKYFYKRILDLFLQEYYEEGLLKLNSLVSILKTEVFKKINKSGKGSGIRFLGEYEICHPLNVATISGLIAKKLDYPIHLLDKVIIAALVHDIGKLKVDLPYPQSLLTMIENEVKNHPILGYRLIKEQLGLPEEVAKVALEHHENNDGSGYPQGLSNDFITEMSQIVNVANYYDNLAFNRTPVLVTNNKDALRTMLEVGTKRFSAKILYTFIHMFNYDDAMNFNDMVL